MKKITTWVIFAVALGSLYWAADRHFYQESQDRLHTWLQEHQYSQNLQWKGLTTSLWRRSTTLTDVQIHITRGPLKGLKIQAHELILSGWHNNVDRRAATFMLNRAKVLQDSDHLAQIIVLSATEEWAYHTGLRALPPIDLSLSINYRPQADTFDYALSINLPELAQANLIASLSQVPDLTSLHNPSGPLNLFNGLPSIAQQKLLYSKIDQFIIEARDLGAQSRALALQERYQWQYSPTDARPYDAQQEQWLQSIRAQYLAECQRITGSDNDKSCDDFINAIEGLNQGVQLSITAASVSQPLQLNDFWDVLTGQQLLAELIQKSSVSVEAY